MAGVGHQIGDHWFAAQPGQDHRDHIAHHHQAIGLARLAPQPPAVHIDECARAAARVVAAGRDVCNLQPLVVREVCAQRHSHTHATGGTGGIGGAIGAIGAIVDLASPRLADSDGFYALCQRARQLGGLIQHDDHGSEHTFW